MFAGKSAGAADWESLRHDSQKEPAEGAARAPAGREERARQKSKLIPTEGTKLFRTRAVGGAGSGSDDTCRKSRDVIADLRAQVEIVADGVAHSGAHGDHRFELVRLGEVAELAQGLIGLFGARTHEHLHAAAGRYEEFALAPAVGVIYEVVMKQMRLSRKDCFGTAAAQFQIILHEVVVEFSAEV